MTLDCQKGIQFGDTPKNAKGKKTSQKYAYLDPRGKIHNLSNYRKVMVNGKGCQNCNGVRIIRQRHGDSIEENGDKDATTRACQDHGNKFIRNRCGFGRCFENFHS